MAHKTTPQKMTPGTISSPGRTVAFGVLFVVAFAVVCTAASCAFPSPDGICTSRPHGWPFGAIGPFCECNRADGGEWLSYSGLTWDLYFYGAICAALLVAVLGFEAARHGTEKPVP